MEFSERLRELRAACGVSQKEVADGAGLSESGYQFYEYGKRAPRVEQLIALADFFDVSVDYLLGRTDEPARPPRPKR